VSNTETAPSYRALWLLVAAVAILVVGIVTVVMWLRAPAAEGSVAPVAHADRASTGATTPPGAASPAALLEASAADTSAMAADPRPELIAIPGGAFWMGSKEDEHGRGPDEGPRHQVSVSKFRLCRTEVTQGQWQAVMGQNPSQCEHGCGSDLPVQNVSWFDAIEYLDRLSEREGLTRCYADRGADGAIQWNRQCTGYRLPTEAEWEYAARAGTDTAYSAGSEPRVMAEHAWFEHNAGARMHPVASKPANPWGLHDMHGNVYEWVWDWHGPYSDAQERDPVGPAEGRLRVMRGGSFVSWSKDIRSANRFGVVPTARGGRGLGLRCARSHAPARLPRAGPGR
jgi:formylglycine-generating enzyme required for sulfatase activity